MSGFGLRSSARSRFGSFDLNKGGGGVRYDYYIDAGLGDDGNAGTASEPWASLSPLVTAVNALSNGVSLRALVRDGTYVDTDRKNSISLGASVNAGVSVIIDCDGAVFQGVSGVDASFLDLVDVTGFHFEINGIGADRTVVTGFDTGTGNALGSNSSASGGHIARRIHGTLCVDGWSLHGSGEDFTVEDCLFDENSKSAFAHVHSGGSARAVDTDFIAKSGAVIGIGTETTTAASENSEYEGCRFIPATNGQALNFYRAKLSASATRNGQIGTLTLRAGAGGASLWSTSGAAAECADHFVHAMWDISVGVLMHGCYGYATVRHRNGAAISSITGNVFAGDANGAVADGFLVANFDPTTAARVEIKNNIFANYAVALGNGYTAGYATDFADSDSRATYNCLYNNTTDINTNLNALGSPYVANNMTGQNPLLGPCNSYDVNDWKVAAGSPTLGAGEGGVDMGLVLAA